MPKKTRKEKIASFYRKKLLLLKQPPTKNITKSIPEIIPINNNQELSDEEKRIVNYFYIDLKKSLIIIAIVITLEFSLYFATINHYLRF